jgi:hypothetical protein
VTQDLRKIQVVPRSFHGTAKELTASVESREFKEQYQVDDLLLVAIAIERATVRLAKHEGLRKWRFDLKRVVS